MFIVCTINLATTHIVYFGILLNCYINTDDLDWSVQKIFVYLPTHTKLTWGAGGETINILNLALFVGKNKTKLSKVSNIITQRYACALMRVFFISNEVMIQCKACSCWRRHKIFEIYQHYTHNWFLKVMFDICSMVLHHRQQTHILLQTKL